MFQIFCCEIIKIVVRVDVANGKLTLPSLETEGMFQNDSESGVLDLKPDQSLPNVKLDFF